MKLMRRSYARTTRLVEQAEAAGVSFTDRITNLVRAHITAVAVWYRPDGQLSLDNITAIVARQTLAVLNVR